LLILDEPTSGLDSSTSLRIIKTLRKEAERGMSIIATIHQPSSELFFQFDRVIVLSEGYCIYNGAPKDVKTYFGDFGLKMNRFSNPADKLSYIASEPKRVLSDKVTIESLSYESTKLQKVNYYLDEETADILQSKLNRRFSVIAETRGVSIWKQFKLIFLRFMLQSLRQPLSVVALIFMGTF